MLFLYDFHEVNKTTNQAPKQKLIFQRLSSKQNNFVSFMSKLHEENDPMLCDVVGKGSE